MVLIHIKRSADNTFLFEGTTAATVDDVTRELAVLHNDRLRVERVCVEMEELAKHGPAKPPGKEGIDKYGVIGGLAEGVDELSLSKEFANYQQDPQGKRTGDAPSAQLAGVLRKQVAEAVAAVSVKQAEMKVALTSEMMAEQLRLLGGAVTIAFPQGLPEYDPVKVGVEDAEDLGGEQASLFVLDPETCVLWWAGKMMNRDAGKILSDFVGRNEKTKIVAKLQKAGSGAPQREPAISEDEQKAMMAFYHKKQEQQKKMAANDEDDYVNSSWANPASLKDSMQGMGGIKAPGIGR